MVRSAEDTSVNDHAQASVATRSEVGNWCIRVNGGLNLFALDEVVVL